MRYLVSTILVSLLYSGCSSDESQDFNGDLNTAKVSLEDAMDDPAAIADNSCKHSSGEDGVYICHVPPGNPDAKHDICVGVPALQGHSNHEGDYLGKCDADPDDEPSEDDEEEEQSEETGGAEGSEEGSGENA